MSRRLGFLLAGAIVLVASVATWWFWPPPPPKPELSRIEEVRLRVTPRLKESLQAAGFSLGDPLFIRIFKESRQVELWLRPQGEEQFRFFRGYPTWFSGQPGPKLAEGDFQAPEGFYHVGPAAMNPESDIHLSFNLGFPNEFDASLGRTGSWIMMHGGRGSVGCFAMTHPVIEEIYLIAEAALAAGQEEFWVHVFPFRMTGERIQAAADGRWLPFWENLREGYDLFEKTHVPPVVGVEGQRYVFGPRPAPPAGGALRPDTTP